MREMISDRQMRALHAAARDVGANHEDIRRLAASRFFETSLNDLNTGAAHWMIEHYVAMRPLAVTPPRIVGALPRVGPFARPRPSAQPAVVQQPDPVIVEPSVPTEADLGANVGCSEALKSASSQSDSIPPASAAAADPARRFEDPPPGHEFYGEKLTPKEQGRGLEIITRARRAVLDGVPVKDNPYGRAAGSRFWQRRLYVTAFDQAMMEATHAGLIPLPVRTQSADVEVDAGAHTGPFAEMSEPLPKFEPPTESIEVIDANDAAARAMVDEFIASDTDDTDALARARDFSAADDDDDDKVDLPPDHRVDGFFGIADVRMFGPSAGPAGPLNGPEYEIPPSMPPVRSGASVPPKPAASPTPAAKPTLPPPPRPTFLDAPTEPALAAQQNQSASADLSALKRFTARQPAEAPPANHPRPEAQLPQRPRSRSDTRYDPVVDEIPF